MSKKKDKAGEVEIVNRKAKFEYSFIATIEAGIKLTGTEIKSIRAGQANLKEAYCVFRKGELFIRQMNIAEYKYGNQNNHEPKRERKLLLKRAELKKFERRVKEKGYTIVPYRLYFNERGYAKIEIALAQGKASYDKRDTIKERQNKREMDRLKKIKL